MERSAGSRSRRRRGCGPDFRASLVPRRRTRMPGPTTKPRFRAATHQVRLRCLRMLDAASPHRNECPAEHPPLTPQMLKLYLSFVPSGFRKWAVIVPLAFL
jgi:hypothetical protein